MERSNLKKKNNKKIIIIAWNQSSIKNATIGLHEMPLQVKLKKTKKKFAWNSSSWSSSSIKNATIGLPMERSDLKKKKKKNACFKTPLQGFKMPLQGFKKLHGTRVHGAQVPAIFFFFNFQFVITRLSKNQVTKQGHSPIQFGKGDKMRYNLREKGICTFAHLGLELNRKDPRLIYIWWSRKVEEI